MYIMKNGAVINQYKIDTDFDSIIFYEPITGPTSGAFTDSRDNTVYNWVKIGNQVWMAENLKYLPSVVGPNTGSLTTPYYYVYGYDGADTNAAKATSNYATYGVLYNWPAAMNGSESSTANPSKIQGACPTGWHLPSNAEWSQLTDYFGDNECGKLKATTLWNSPNTGATNEKGFTAFPGGSRGSDGTFYYLGLYGSWWSAAKNDATTAGALILSYDNSSFGYHNFSLSVGFSVRCVRD